MSETLSLKIATRAEELDRVAIAVEELGERESWPMDLFFHANLALEEIVLNIINHGHIDGSHEIEITMTSEPEALTIQIIDDGQPFDPLTDAPDPNVDAAIEDRRIGGLGVHLVRTLMEMSYQRSEGKNRLTLISRRTE